MEGCKFCAGKAVNAEEFVENGGYKTVRMMIGMLTGSIFDDEDTRDSVHLEQGNLLCFDNSSGEYQQLGVRINYCPLCGAELKENVNIEEENLYDPE